MADSKKILDLADPKKFLLIADLFSNNSDLARAAEEAGADAVILHLNESPAQGARFGGLEIEEDSIKECLDGAKVPFGLAVGDARLLTSDEWERCVALGFSFVNMFAHHMPTFVWKDERISKIASLGPGYILEQIRAIAEFKEFAAFVASFTPMQGFGSNLNVLDVTTLKLIMGLAKKPVLFPTQKLVRMEDIAMLRSLGLRGIIVTSISYGNSADTLKETLKDFKCTIASLPVSASKK